MALQTAFYIVGIVFMGLSLLLLVGLLAIIITIRIKIAAIQRGIQERIEFVQNLYNRLAPLYKYAVPLLRTLPHLRRFRWLFRLLPK